jgi:hypothetical protein
MILNIIGPKQLTEETLFQVHKFRRKCKELNYKNNISLYAMKWYDATWFAHYYDNNIISLSGVHKFLDGHRVMFRGATLPGYTSKHLNKEQAYAQMDYIGESIFYFTLNCDDSTGVKSNRLRKYVRSGKGWPGSVYVKTEKIFDVDQEIWRI